MYKQKAEEISQCTNSIRIIIQGSNHTQKNIDAEKKSWLKS